MGGGPTDLASLTGIPVREAKSDPTRVRQGRGSARNCPPPRRGGGTIPTQVCDLRYLSPPFSYSASAPLPN